VCIAWPSFSLVLVKSVFGTVYIICALGSIGIGCDLGVFFLLYFFCSGSWGKAVRNRPFFLFPLVFRVYGRRCIIVFDHVLSS
jgi:hypothetical protein